MRITEDKLRRIIKETLHHMAAAAAAGAAGSALAKRRKKRKSASEDEQPKRSGRVAISAAGTPQNLSDEKVKQMYADLRKGSSNKFFDIFDDIDMYTRAREVSVVQNADETEISVEMKLYNRDNQVGGFTEENYKEWVDDVCPILRHDFRLFKKFEKLWASLSLKSESRLRKIIRSEIIKELNMYTKNF